MTREEARDKLVDIKAQLQSLLAIYYNGAEVTDAFDVAIKALEQEPKVGHWIEENKGTFGTYPRCSECSELYRTKERYCPNCGARMSGGE